jgi:O-antigen/teichoic acid export membrane protein
MLILRANAPRASTDIQDSLMECHPQKWAARMAFLRPTGAVGLAYQSDNLIITHVFNPEAVAQYAVPQKLFNLISIAIGIIVGPLWPVYGEAIARGDGHWVKQTLVRSLIGAVSLASLMGVTFVLLGPKDTSLMGQR